MKLLFYFQVSWLDRERAYKRKRKRGTVSVTHLTQPPLDGKLPPLSGAPSGVYATAAGLIGRGWVRGRTYDDGKGGVGQEEERRGPEEDGELVVGGVRLAPPNGCFAGAREAGEGREAS